MLSVVSIGFQCNGNALCIASGDRICCCSVAPQSLAVVVDRRAYSHSSLLSRPCPQQPVDVLVMEHGPRQNEI
ncbi:hypothetical protein HBH56_046000 [Parastagonospora nodorum]|uniref:Uncharacterized protein n=1 Tax=Phaeosphaeria nodorum (strain SN15 / ATCC MYA-4574 / FGSC 10173) TaxID=321614 RepID=A0A7U2ETQ6_PHANO|nr:hypothetical protein HBH56_046000 [Parastagonospora nodorum]QRC92642.1 hypothetical protein JI435_402790 [Parastagonospora nodorum SN15]KAH3933191.1 hypothetical protein HBH54_073750 [Parastagonospora nodorum]KAH3946198.1 hypothetical protein HBH53_132900 [Parastagonospora nodorum]KAH3973344.1 hypothetical protein HBH52_145800 [Parastagonospora nodorum]